MEMKPSFDLETVYVQLLDGPEVARVEVSPEFWQEISNRPELHEGRLVSVLPYTEDYECGGRIQRRLATAPTEAFVEEGDMGTIVTIPSEWVQSFPCPLATPRSASWHRAGSRAIVAASSTTRPSGEHAGRWPM